MEQYSHSAPLFETHLRSLKKIHQGKVRDIYDVDDQHLLIVATDRLSAFDVVLPDPIPFKGQVLTQISLFWFGEDQRTSRPTISRTCASRMSISDAQERAQLDGRAMVVKKLTALPLEAVVRGYLIGSGYKDYKLHGSICGIPLPAGLAMAERLPEPLFTPASKAPAGAHDENIDFDAIVKLVGKECAADIRRIALEVYRFAAEHARARNIIIADTKFEFGVDKSGKLFLIDEALTPDSSRFWPMASYKPGISPPSFDKQFVRDYLESLHWNKKPPAPHLPPEILARTSDNYREALKLLRRPLRLACPVRVSSNMFKWFETLEDGLFTGSRSMPPPWGPMLRVVRYPAALIRDWLRGEISVRAMSLAYTTLLSIVPLLVFSFAILKSLGARGDLKFILSQFFAPMGGAADQLTESVLQFVRNMRGDLLGSIGLIFLVYTVVTTIQKVETSFNFLWRVDRPRSFLRRFSEYLAVMILGPILLAVALGLLASAERSPFALWVERDHAAGLDLERRRQDPAVRDRHRHLHLHVCLHPQHQGAISGRADRRHYLRHRVGAGRQGVHGVHRLFLVIGGDLHRLCHRADHAHLGLLELADLAHRRAARVLSAISAIPAPRPGSLRTHRQGSRAGGAVDHVPGRPRLFSRQDLVVGACAGCGTRHSQHRLGARAALPGAKRSALGDRTRAIRAGPRHCGDSPGRNL